MSFVLKASLLSVCAGVLLSGCAAAMPRPIQTDAALGRVVVYRNGVAYFERRAVVHGDRFALEVPAERLDDFLKSLSVVDARTGNAVPISFPTLEHAEGMTTVMVNLPKAGDYDLRISYVTESPAWKPTYRLQLEEGGSAELQSWAVVDNVSGEDWTKVAVGVGSTSALSFKYDLRSVRYVERETLSDTSELGLAPPTGGSSYAVASKELRVLGNFGADAVDDLKKSEHVLPKSSAHVGGGCRARHAGRSGVRANDARGRETELACAHAGHHALGRAAQGQPEQGQSARLRATERHGQRRQITRASQRDSRPVARERRASGSGRGHRHRTTRQRRWRAHRCRRRRRTEARAGQERKRAERRRAAGQCLLPGSVTAHDRKGAFGDGQPVDRAGTGSGSVLLRSDLDARLEEVCLSFGVAAQPDAPHARCRAGHGLPGRAVLG